ncbi:MAG: hypothetical protein KJN98_01640, partial [Pontiella sp.]|nr:hypothetical protein [Pontiella sp.]
ISGIAQEPSDAPPASKLDDFMETGMEVEGVRAPYYDDEGNLQAQLYGGYAKVLENGLAEVTNLRVDVYQNDRVALTIFAPHCFTQVVGDDGAKSLIVFSDGDVLIEMTEMSIIGQGFRFSSTDNRFEILRDSKVLLKESARKMEEIEL